MHIVPYCSFLTGYSKSTASQSFSSVPAFHLSSTISLYKIQFLSAYQSESQWCISLTLYERVLICHRHITNPPCPSCYCSLKEKKSQISKNTFLFRNSDNRVNVPTDTHVFSRMSKRLLDGFQRPKS